MDKIELKSFISARINAKKKNTLKLLKQKILLSIDEQDLDL